MKFIISDIESVHAESVKAALLLGANGVLSSGDIEIRYNGLSADMEYAASVGAAGVIRSTTGIYSFLALALAYYNTNDIQTFVPAGSNTPGEIFESSGGTNLPSIVVTGAGDIHNETADDIEFFAPDPITIEPDYSSFANAVIAGQLYYIKVMRNCTWWEARYCARVTGSKSGVWDEVDGHGLINTAAAIAHADAIPDDPYITLPEAELGAVGALTGINTDSAATLYAGNVINAQFYYLEKKKSEMPDGRSSIAKRRQPFRMYSLQIPKQLIDTGQATPSDFPNIPDPLHSLGN